MNWKVKIVVFPLIAYFLSFCLGVVFYGFVLLDRIGDIQEEEVVYAAESFDIDVAEDKADTIEQEEIVFASRKLINPSESVINILLVGKDVKDSDPDSGRTDSMILLSLNRDTKQISMVSLMRDCYVQIPGYSNNKLNAAYNIGGYSLLNETLLLNFGIQVDYNVGVNFTSFTKVIDKLGGIDIELTEEEAQYILQKTKKDSGLQAGVNHLSGKQALWYARTRYVSTPTESNDFGRTSRQRIVLQTVYKELMSLSLDQIIDIMYEVVEDVETDMSIPEIISLGTEVYSMNLSEINTYRIPYSNEYTDEIINRMMVLVIDFDKAQQHLNEWLYNQ